MPPRSSYSKQEYHEKVKTPYKNYCNEVKRLTKKQPLHQLENYKLRGRNKYHLDHIISMKYGFDHNIHPEIIADIRNLRFIPASQNHNKSDYFEMESHDLLIYFIEHGYKCNYTGI